MLSIKHHAELKLILRGQNLALGHINPHNKVFWLRSKIKFTDRTI